MISIASNSLISMASRASAHGLALSQRGILSSQRRRHHGRAQALPAAYSSSPAAVPPRSSALPALRSRRPALRQRPRRSRHVNDLNYPKQGVGKTAALKVNQPIGFATRIRVVALRDAAHGVARCAGGVGPNRDIVAYSMLCTHMGCPVSYDAGTSASFKCPCHFSMFDAELGGQMICGQATENLPRRSRCATTPRTARHRGGRATA